LKWGLAAFTFIGALLGVGVTLWLAVSTLIKNGQHAYVLLPIFFIVMALYALGAVAAILFARNTQHRGLLRFYYALQIIALNIPWLVWRFSSGAYLIPTLGLENKQLTFGMAVWLGSDWQFYISTSGANATWEVGINLVAIAVLWLLRSRSINK